jgi:predicted AAA+ superfamily ATPase
MILKSVLFNIINAQQKLFFSKDSGIYRELKIDLAVEDKQLIIINGIKRTGKSTFLFQLYKQHFQDVFYINFGHPGLYDFDQNDFFKLDEIIKAFGNKVLFFDEITELTGWQSYIRQKLDENFKVLITASNSEILNNDSAFKLTGRYITTDLLPFSYEEFCTCNQLERNEKSVLSYMQNGGFPGQQNSNNSEYLSQLFDDIVVREIGLRFGIRDIKSFKRLAMHLLVNIGELISGNQIKNKLGIKTTSTAIDYLSYLEAGFLIYYLPKFSYSIRKQMVNPRKVYVIDTGFFAANIFAWEEKIEQLLENLVFLKLRNIYTELYYFAENRTCDFIAFGQDKAIQAIQVTCNLQQDNYENELNGLYEAMDFFEFTKGTIVTMNQTDRFERDGKVVDVIPFYDF